MSQISSIMIREEFTFNLYNTHFYGRYFKPKNVKGAIVLVHGMGEHSKRYENFVIPYFYQKSEVLKGPFIFTRMYTRMGRGLYSCLIF